MGAFSKWDRIQNTRHPVKNGKCKACGRPVMDMTSVWVAVLSYAYAKYSILCPECYRLRAAKTAGESRPEKEDRSKPDYTIPEIVRACKQTVLRLKVENNPLATAVDEWNKENDWRGRDNLLAGFLCCFPLGLKQIATDQLHGHLGGGTNTIRPGNYEAHRIQLFVATARLLRPFLPRVTGMMLDRVYQGEMETLRKKAEERGRRNAWRQAKAAEPARLFPISWDTAKIAEWLLRKMPKSVTVITDKSYPSYYPNKEEKAFFQALGVSDAGGESIRGKAKEISLVWFNEANGPRFIIKI